MDAHDQRLRQAQIREKLRILRLERPLLLDMFYAGGSLSGWQWSAGHLFREDRLLLIDARARGQVRKRASDLKPRHAGFSMASIGVERALSLENWLEPQWHEWALALIGELMIEIEVPWAQRVLVALGEFYGVRPARIVAGRCGG